MNDLIDSIAKERILPITTDTIDIPNNAIYSQLTKFSIYITDMIITYYQIQTQLNLTNEEKLDLAIDLTFPLKWLEIAKYCVAFHIDMTDCIKKRIDLDPSLIVKINNIVEFLCFEIIETSVLLSDIIYISDLTPLHLLKAIDCDYFLSKIIYSCGIYITYSNIIPINYLEINGIDISNKSHKILRLFIEILIKKIIFYRRNDSIITIRDIHRIL